MGTFFVKWSIWLMILIALAQIHGYEGCSEKERTALLQVKAFLNSKYTNNEILISWVNDDRMSDCCSWERVKCNTTTRRVIQLSLFAIIGNGFPLLNLSMFSPFEELRSLDLSLNLLEEFYENRGSYNSRSLRQLEILNLGSNNFNDNILPYLTSITSLKTLILSGNNMAEIFKSNRGLGNLRKLEMLDLSNNGINGSIPSQGLTNLKSLKLLDLSYNYISGSLSSQGICALKNLVELDLGGNNLDGQLSHCLNNLTYLKVLDLSENQLSGKLLPSIIANLTSNIEYLSLVGNNFQGLFSFNSLANLSKLQVFKLSSSLLQIENETFPWHPSYQLKALNLKNCNLQTIPSFLLYQYDLRFIDLSHNKLFGDFPTWLLQNNTELGTLYLRNNSLSGVFQLPNSKHGLLHLDISKNNFSGKLPRNMGKILPKMLDLNMSGNSFEGSIPSSMGETKSLNFLDLSSNNFSGALPREFFTGCFSLSFLCLSNNKFQGEVFPSYMNLTQLTWLFLEENNFSGKIQDGLSKATSLYVFDVSNNMISGQIPDWIGNFSTLEVFLISDNLLEGNIPVQLSNLQYLLILDISENRFSESMASSLNLSSLQHLYMHKNAFNGSIPNALQRSSKLVTLVLRDNQFSGSIPYWINTFSSLRILLLRGNQLGGHIPNQLCQLKELSILDISYNRFNGSIPACFTNMTLWMLEYASDKLLLHLNFLIPGFSDTYYNSTLGLGLRQREVNQRPEQLEVDFTTKNRYESYGGDVLSYMTGLDLSCNELIGDIPSEIGNLQQIHALNLSHNFLTGSIPESFSNMKMIESLDLSHNKLSGQISPQLAKLNFLSNFNVSYNNLSGPTPNAGQFANFDESNYRGNPDLCGLAIKKSCSNTPASPKTPSSGLDEEDESAIDMVAFYWSFVASCVTFTLGLFVILWLNLYWRRMWFYFIEECIDSCFYWVFKSAIFFRNCARP